MKALRIGNKNIKDIKKETGLSHETVRVHIADLEKEGMVMRATASDRRQKIYSLTSQGFLKLNDFDAGLRAEYFLFQLQMALVGRIWTAAAQDRRLPESEINNIRVAIIDKLIPSFVNKDLKSLSEYGNIIKEIHSRNNILPPFQPHESDLNNLKLFAGEIILYMTARAAQDNNQEYLKLLQYLPQWYLELMKTNLIDTDYIISNINMRAEIEYCLSAGQDLTLKDYKKFMKDIGRLKKHQENLEE